MTGDREGEGPFRFRRAVPRECRGGLPNLSQDLTMGSDICDIGVPARQ